MGVSIRGHEARFVLVGLRGSSKDGRNNAELGPCGVVFVTPTPIVHHVYFKDTRKKKPK